MVFTLEHTVVQGSELTGVNSKAQTASTDSHIPPVEADFQMTGTTNIVPKTIPIQFAIGPH